MAVLEQLGINGTVLYQLIIFMFAFISLRYIMFEPYFKALDERKKRTVGDTQQAEELKIKSADAKSQYEAKARHINAELKDIFGSSRGEAAKEYERLIANARTTAEKLIDENRKRIKDEAAQAEAQLKGEIPAVAAAITQKMLG